MSPAASSDTADILVAGSVAVDLSCDVDGSSPQLHTSNPASVRNSIGGVGHNVARAAHLGGGGQLTVRLCSLVGNDMYDGSPPPCKHPSSSDVL